MCTLPKIFHHPNLCSVRCHIVHLSSARALPTISEAKAAGAQLSVETCHHYLNFDAETIPDKATHLKCCPPIRSKDNQVYCHSTVHIVVIPPTCRLAVSQSRNTIYDFSKKS